MQSTTDILDHVAAATGLDRADAEKAVAAAFAFVREAAREGRSFDHPALGQIRAVERQTDAGEKRIVFRYRPDAGGGAGSGRGKGKRRAGPEA